jgi:hypothetical protein
MFFPPMVTRWHAINFAITSPEKRLEHMPHLTWELAYCLDVIYEILDDLEDIRIGLETGLDISTFLSPTFDPLRTFGKYE